MNGATLRTYRALLGYEARHYAEKIGVARRTLTRWEVGEWAVPDDVAEQVRKDLSDMNRLRDLIVDDLRGEDSVEVLAYEYGGDLKEDTGISVDRQVYNAAVGQAALELEAAGTEVTIQWRKHQEA